MEGSSQDDKKIALKPPASIDDFKYKDEAEAHELTLQELQEKTKTVNLYKDRYFLRTDKDGLLEKVDVLTGEVERLSQNSYEGYSSEEMAQDNFYSFTDEEGAKVLVPKSLQFDEVFLKKFGKKTPFNPAIATEIVEKVMDGWTFKKITMLNTMPSRYELWLWRKNNPAFDKELMEAVKFRAENFQEKLMDDIDLLEEKNLHNHELKTMALKHRTLQKMIDREDRKADSQSKNKGTGNNILNVQINTGFSPDSTKGVEQVKLEDYTDEDLK